MSILAFSEALSASAEALERLLKGFKDDCSYVRDRDPKPFFQKLKKFAGKDWLGRANTARQ